MYKTLSKHKQVMYLNLEGTMRAMLRVSGYLAILVLAIVATLAPLSTAHALSVSWTTTGSDSTDPRASGLAGDVGNIKTFNSTSFDTVAFSIPYSAGSQPAIDLGLPKAYLASFTGGLGVANALS